MWTPKSEEFEQLANKIAQEYTENRLSVFEIARIYKLHISSIFRYLKYKGISYRSRNRDEKGKFLPSR